MQSFAKIQLNWFFDIIMAGIAIDDYFIRGFMLHANIPQDDLDSRINNYNHQEELQRRAAKQQERKDLIDRLKDKDTDEAKGILLAIGE